MLRGELPTRRELPGSYWRQWSASAVSNLGDGINFAAMPLLALSITDDERLLSLTVFATLLPWLLLALPIGVAVDKFDRQVLMVGSNLARLALLALIAFAVVGDSLSIWGLLGLLLVIGACEVTFDSSAQAFLPMIVPPADLQRANGYLVGVEVVAGSLVGLSLGAFLFEGGRGVPFIVNAASFGVAAVLIASIRVTARAPQPPKGHDQGGVRVGVRWLLDDQLLRTLAAMLAVTNFGFMLGQGIFVKYAADELGVTGAGYGVLLAVTALGAVSAGVVGHRLARRLGTTLGIIVPFVVFGAGQIVLGTSPVTWVVAVTGFMLSGSVTLWNVVTVSLRQQLIPQHLFGRVNSVYRWVGTGASAIGALVGGQVAYHLGLQAPFLLAGLTTIAAFAFAAFPLLRGVNGLRLMDQAVERTPAPPSIT